MKSIKYFYLVVIACSLMGLFIQLWFAPFVMALVTSYLFDVNTKQAIWVHLGIYAIACALFCTYAYTTGSKELVTMIGEIFKGISFLGLLLLSCLFYGVTALMGAWVGVAIRN